MLSMCARRNIFLLLLYITAAKSLPNILNDWDSQISNPDSIAFSETGLLDMDVSQPQGNSLFDVGGDEFLSFNGDLSPAGAGFAEAPSSIFQDLIEDESSISKPSVDSSNLILSPPVMNGMGELAKDDICPEGYWNRCCHDGVCFWGRFCVEVGISDD